MVYIYIYIHRIDVKCNFDTNFSLSRNSTDRGEINRSGQNFQTWKFRYYAKTVIIFIRPGRGERSPWIVYGTRRENEKWKSRFDKQRCRRWSPQYNYVPWRNRNPKLLTRTFLGVFRPLWRPRNFTQQRREGIAHGGAFPCRGSKRTYFFPLLRASFSSIIGPSASLSFHPFDSRNIFVAQSFLTLDEMQKFQFKIGTRSLISFQRSILIFAFDIIFLPFLLDTYFP